MPSPPISPQHKEAVIAIQGGGVYGFTLLGQLQAVLEHKYVPLAFAGTSAGAIVASLAWCGYNTREILGLFTGLAQCKPEKLTPLLGPFSPAEFDASAFAAFRKSIGQLFDWAFASDHKWHDPETWKRLCQALSLFQAVKPHVARRGFFSGEQLERQLEIWLRARMPQVSAIVPEGRPITFHHVSQLVDQRRIYRPPLLLTATNLTKKRIEIISSIDPRYAKVSVAKAVRASAGFPGFFMPSELPECPDGGGWFVDGGLVSNFPIWTFSDTLRAEIQKSDLEGIYSHLVNKPWIRIGLRVVDDAQAPANLAKPKHFFLSLGTMLSSGTRNELEELLAQNTPRSVIIKQPYSETDGPDDVLNVAMLNQEKMEQMVSRGRSYAYSYLEGKGSPSSIIGGPVIAERVARQLEDMVRKCDLIFKSPEECKFRANVFMPIVVQEGGQFQHHMRLLYSFNMDGDGDRDMEFPDLQSGATGFCYWSRRPQVCNLLRIGELVRSDPTKYKQMFGMGPHLHGKVRDDRSWLASVPIFDPHEVRVAKGPSSSRHLLHKGQWYTDIETGIEGPVLGVLNLDAGWDYRRVLMDEDLKLQVIDKRVQAVLAIMQVAAFGIARTVSGEFN